MATTEPDTLRDERDPISGPVYDGFISYSHRADDLLAPRLQAGLQRFAKPWWRRRALRIFRDNASLAANPHLWESITDALDQAGWFIVLMSPRAGESEWVNLEVEYWLEHKDRDRIIPVLTEGDYRWSEGHIVSNAAPPALLDAFSDQPRWVDMRFARTDEQLDLRNASFRAAVADIAAPIRGIPKDELESEEVRQHRRTVRTVWAAGVALLALVVIAGAAAVYANGQRGEAIEQAAVARSRELAASSVSVLEDQPELAMLLALESIHTTPLGAETSPVGVLALRDAMQQNRLLRRLSAGPPWIFGAISDDGSTVFISSETDRAVKAVDVASGSVLWTYHDPSTIDAFGHLAVAPDSQYVAVSIYDFPAIPDETVPVDDAGNDAHPMRTIVLDGQTGAVVHVLLPGACSSVEAGGFSPDGKWLAVASGSDQCLQDPDAGWVSLYDTATWEESGPRLRIEGGLFEQVSFSEDGSLVLLHEDGEGIVELRSFPDLALINTLPNSRWAELSPDGEVAAVVPFAVGADLRPLLVRAESGERIAYLDAVDDFTTGDGLRFSADQSVIAVTTRARDYVFDAASGRLLVALGHTGLSYTQDLASDGSRLVTSHESEVLVWDLAGAAVATGRSLTVDGVPATWIKPNRVTEGKNLAVRVFIPDGPSEREDTTVIVVVDPETGATTEHYAGDGVQLGNGHFVVAERPLGTETPRIGPLIVVDPATGVRTELDDCVALVADLLDWRPIDCPGPFFGWVDIDFNPIVAAADGSRFVGNSYVPSPSLSRTIRVWDAATLEVDSEFEIPAHHTVFAAGDTWVAVHDFAPQSLVVYDIDSGAVVAELESSGPHMATSTDGSVLFTAGFRDGDVVMFDTATWELVARWPAHDAGIRGLAVSPDGTRLASTGEDNFVKVWDIAESGDQPPVLLDRIPADFPSDASWLAPDRLAVFLADGARYLDVSLGVDELVDGAIARLTRGFTVGECATYQIDPCWTLEEIRNRAG